MPVDKSDAQVRRMFGEIAPRYDLLNHLLSLNVDRYWRWRTVRLVPPSGAAPILDVCSGTGDLALAYQRASEGKTPVVATDFCHPMLVRALDKSRRGPAKIPCIESDAQRLPFTDSQFQIVCVAFGLRNVANTDQGLREMARVCRPGGAVAVLEFSQPTFPPFRAVYGWYFRKVLPKIGQWFSRNRQEAYAYLPASVAEFPSGEALAHRMRAVGLEDVTWKPFTLGIATLYVGRKPAGHVASDVVDERQHAECLTG